MRAMNREFGLGKPGNMDEMRGILRVPLFLKRNADLEGLALKPARLDGVCDNDGPVTSKLT
jgi:hypothetical protein